MAKIETLDQVRLGGRRLIWPEHKPRAASRINGPFKGHSIDGVIRELGWEMKRWGIGQDFYLISRNTDRMFAGDPAVVLWWETHEGELRVLACDRYKLQACNAHAIFLTLEAMRALQRWGAYSAEEAAQGAKARQLPPPETKEDRPWREVLAPIPNDLDPEDTLTIAAKRYHTKSAEAGDVHAKRVELNLAIEQAREELQRSS